MGRLLYVSLKGHCLNKGRRDDVVEEADLEKRGAATIPNSNPIRPFFFLGAPLVCFTVFAGGAPPPFSYGGICLGLYALFGGAAAYFRDTTMYPPKKKKTLTNAWNWTKEKMALRRPAVQGVNVQV